MTAFWKILYEAIQDVLRHGFDSSERLRFWRARLRTAISQEIPSDQVQRDRLQQALQYQFRKTLRQSRRKSQEQGVSGMDIQRLAPQLQNELEKRIVASTALIKLNRERMVERTLQRFEGWMSSIPEGGTRRAVARKTASHIAKPLRQQSYEERRLHIDQGHKLVAAIDRVIAQHSGAIAMIWHSHWRAPGYNYRPDHKERDEKLYLLRDSWALKEGLIAKGSAEYTDQITAPGEEVYCRCKGEYVYALRDLPEAMLTEKGKKALKDAQARFRSSAA